MFIYLLPIYRLVTNYRFCNPVQAEFSVITQRLFTHLCKHFQFFLCTIQCNGGLSDGRWYIFLRHSCQTGSSLAGSGECHIHLVPMVRICGGISALPRCLYTSGTKLSTRTICKIRDYQGCEDSYSVLLRYDTVYNSLVW
jgi:hypothetical protein